jgi:hypothetical protein
MSFAVEFLLVIVFAAMCVGLLWSPVILLAVRGRRHDGGRGASLLFRTWATIGLVGAALALVAFIAVVAFPK